MNMLAPELSALITILRSVGPVISTRRSCKSFGTAATSQSASRIGLVSGEEVRQLAGVDFLLSLDTAGEQFDPACIETAMQFGQKAERFAGEYLRILGGDAAEHMHAGWNIRLIHVEAPKLEFYIVKNDFAK